LTRFIAIADNYADVYAAFQWKLPKQYNIAWDVCDRHAGDPAKIALIHHLPDQVRKYTFRDIQVLANRLANTFEALGLRQGDRVLIALGQHPVTAFSHVACWKAGLISVPTSTLFGVDGLEYRLNHSGASVLITDSTNLPKALEAQTKAPALQHIFVIDGSAVDGVLPLIETIERASSEYKTLALTPDTPAFINYTSGTTGWPKGALQGHRAMLGHVPGAEVLYDLYPQPGDLLWSPADWAWRAGLMMVLMAAWFHGKPVLAFPMKEFDPALCLAMMGRHQVRNSLLTPTMLKLFRPVSHLVAEKKVRLRSIVSGSEAVGKELLLEMNSVFGVTINEGFGQTECATVLGNCASLGCSKTGSLGVALPGHVGGIVDSDGNLLPDGEVGILAFKRPDPVMLLEYWRDPQATEEKFAGDWLLTGDLASRDEDGFFWFIGREDDVITSSGYRIGPGEIEDTIQRHPAVSLTAVIGVPDPVRTESIRAYVVLASGYSPSADLADEIRLSVRDRLARHEYPREIVFIDSLPMTTTGKVLRRALRDQAIAEKPGK
jgi:acetyl-CoA synthetase